MGNLTRNQIFLLGCFTASALVVANTFFMKGDIQTFGYVLISMVFAGFTVIVHGGQKNKRENQ
jgi:hypothetical protein